MRASPQGYGLRELRRLPPRVALFYLRAARLAKRLGDEQALRASTAPADIAALLRLARGRERLVEIGTAAGWTTLGLALADPGCRVESLDPVVHPQRARYEALVPQRVRARVRFLARSGIEPGDARRQVDLVFIDAAHHAQATVAFFEAWQERVAPGGLVVFHDYGAPGWPGVAEGVRLLGLDGRAEGAWLYVWEKA